MLYFSLLQTLAYSTQLVVICYINTNAGLFLELITAHISPEIGINYDNRFENTTSPIQEITSKTRKAGFSFL